jgi:hypothetical protein
MRKPVLFYILAISTMMAMAAGVYAIDGSRAIPLGAFLFLVSSLAVARGRFIAPGFINRAWGLPLCFRAQMILASSVTFQPPIIALPRPGQFRKCEKILESHPGPTLYFRLYGVNFPILGLLCVTWIFFNLMFCAAMYLITVKLLQRSTLLHA